MGERKRYRRSPQRAASEADNDRAMNHRRVARLAVVAATCVGLGACVVAPSIEPGTTRTILPTHRDLRGGEPAALQRGTIVATPSCVLLEEPIQRIRWLVVWPAGYSGLGGSIVDGDGHPVARVGDVVDLGGGEYREDQYGFLQTLLISEPALGCRGGPYWLATDVSRREGPATSGRDHESSGPGA